MELSEESNNHFENLLKQQQSRIAQLTADELDEIDAVLIDNVSPILRKVSRVIASAMDVLKPRLNGVPDYFYAERLEKIIKDGKAEATGDVHDVRSTEIRLTQN